MSEAQWSTPTEIDAATAAFPAGVSNLMPAMNCIPDEFQRDSNPWVRWQQEWFYCGLKRYPVPRDGINRAAAMRHLGAIQGSWAPKHEHKQAAVAYLASLWFSSPDGEPIKQKAQPEGR